MTSPPRPTAPVSTNLRKMMMMGIGIGEVVERSRAKNCFRCYDQDSFIVMIRNFYKEDSHYHFD